MITTPPESLVALRKLIDAEFEFNDEVLVHLRDVLFPMGQRCEGDGNPITRAIDALEKMKLFVRPTKERSEFARVLSAVPKRRTLRATGT